MAVVETDLMAIQKMRETEEGRKKEGRGKEHRFLILLFYSPVTCGQFCTIHFN